MNNAVVELKQGALASTQSSGRMAVSDIIQHVAVVQEVMRAVMKPDVHYGTIPGTPKPTLYKAGAEVLCMVFRVADTYEVTDLSTADTVRYRVNCIGTHQVSGVVLGSGLGEASSGEEKYKWRKAICKEEFDETPANMRRTKHARGKGGTTYKQEQIRTEPADLANTILKMANKRAKMAMVLNVTAASDCFSQDLEDMDAALVDHLTRHEGDAPTDTPVAKTLPVWPAEAFDKQAIRWEKAVSEGLKTTDEIKAMALSRGELTPAQAERIKAMKKAETIPAADAGSDDDLPWKD
ncbi:MAG: hypothetical protein WC100_02565 [Sterolibacterium sp.]